MNFGNTDQGTTQSAAPSSDDMVAPYFTGGPTAGTLVSVSMYTSTNTPGNIQFGVYNSSMGLIGHSASVATTENFAWLTGAVTGTLNDPSGNYFICWNVDDTAVDGNISGNATGGTNFRQPATAFGNWPSTASFSSYPITDLVAIYFTYVPAATGGASGGGTLGFLGI